jgi:DNA excision repair protein ERCC-4
MPTKELTRDMVTAIVDTREQTPLIFPTMPTARGTLDTGDYSVRGLEQHIAIERKELNDFLACVGRERDRFERELDRLRAFPHRAVVIEADWTTLMAGLWRSQLQPQQVTESVTAWMMRYAVPFFLVGDRAHAQHAVESLLFHAARDRWGELLSFYPTLRMAT